MTEAHPTEVPEAEEKMKSLEKRPAVLHLNRSKSEASSCIEEPFDAFAKNSEEMLELAFSVFLESGCMAAFDIPQQTMLNFLQEIRDMYHENPYHNWNHAVHVMLNCYRFIRPAKLKISNVDMFGLLLSAICHDVDHPGVSNNFLVQNKSELALKYDNQSVLENNSITKVQELLQQQEFNILATFNQTDCAAIFEMFRSFILATDIAVEATHIRLKQIITTKEAEYNSLCVDSPVEIRTAYLSLVLLCADIGIVSEPFEIYLQGIKRLYQENSAMMKSLSVSSFMQGQTGFMNGYANNMYSMLNDAGLASFDVYCQRLCSNANKWKAMSFSEASKLLTAPPPPPPSDRDEEIKARVPVSTRGRGRPRIKISKHLLGLPSSKATPLMTSSAEPRATTPDINSTLSQFKALNLGSPLLDSDTTGSSGTSQHFSHSDSSSSVQSTV